VSSLPARVRIPMSCIMSSRSAAAWASTLLQVEAQSSFTLRNSPKCCSEDIVMRKEMPV
jgi:hypothetical protein